MGTIIAVGRVTGTLLAVAGLFGTHYVATAGVDAAAVFGSSMQWGAIGVLGALLIIVFCVYLPIKDKMQADMQARLLETVERMEARFDARSERLASAFDHMADIGEKQQQLCAEAHEIMRRACPHEEGQA